MRSVAPAFVLAALLPIAGSAQPAVAQRGEQREAEEPSEQPSLADLTRAGESVSPEAARDQECLSEKILDRLEGPDGEKASGGHGGSVTRTFEEWARRFESRNAPRALLSSFARQLETAGWAAVSSQDDGAVAVGSWRFSDSGGQAWHAMLVVFASYEYPETKRDVSLRLTRVVSKSADDRRSSPPRQTAGRPDSGKLPRALEWSGSASLADVTRAGEALTSDAVRDPRASFLVQSVLARLEGPEGERATGGGGGSLGREYELYTVPFESHNSATRLLSSFSRQLEAAGWAPVSPHDDDPVAFASSSFSDATGQRWHALLIVFPLLDSPETERAVALQLTRLASSPAAAGR